MNRQKTHRFRPALYHASAGGARTPDTAAKRSDRDDDHERRGWEAYRKWLATMSARPVSDRTPLDHSIYSWKGYQSWADKVRQNWKPDKG